jgi:hypothetical protein
MGKLLPYEVFEAMLADEKRQDGAERAASAFEHAARVIKGLQSLLAS